MENNKIKVSRYYLGEKTLIGYRDDDTLFWLKTDKDYWNPAIDKLGVLEGGVAWIDDNSDTTILDFPTKDEEKLNKLRKELLKGRGRISHYKESDFYVQLAECGRCEPIKIHRNDTYQRDYHCDLPDQTQGYILNEDTYLKENKISGELSYFQFSGYDNSDIQNDRFGWMESARQFSEVSSDEELLYWLRNYVKESYGKAWIDKEYNLLVLGIPTYHHPEIIDSFYIDDINGYEKTYSQWNQTQYWIEIDSGRKINPFDFRVNYFCSLEENMG